MPKHFDVEYYIQWASKRIDTACQHEAAKNKLDYETLREQVIKEARADKDTYDDSMGTGGFMRWLAIRIHNAKVKMLRPDWVKPIASPIKPIPQVIPEPEPPVEEEKPRPGERNTKWKICLQCKVKKDLDDYYNNKNSKDGKSSACKKCLNKPKPKVVNKITASGTPSDMSFTNEEIDMMIQTHAEVASVIEAQLIELSVTREELENQLERRKAIIKKLEARRK